MSTQEAHVKRERELFIVRANASLWNEIEWSGGHAMREQSSFVLHRSGFCSHRHFFGVEMKGNKCQYKKEQISHWQPRFSRLFFGTHNKHRVRRRSGSFINLERGSSTYARKRSSGPSIFSSPSISRRARVNKKRECKQASDKEEMKRVEKFSHKWLNSALQQQLLIARAHKLIVVAGWNVESEKEAGSAADNLLHLIYF
jgi:hypothetical protein